MPNAVAGLAPDPWSGADRRAGAPWDRYLVAGAGAVPVYLLTEPDGPAGAPSRRVLA